MKLSLTNDSSINRRFVLLSPPAVSSSSPFKNAEVDPSKRQALLAEMQRFRGRVYLDDGAISDKDLTADGRHCQSADEKSWHLLILSPQDNVLGCTRYMQHSAATSFKRLHVSDAALTRSKEWSGPLRRSVKRELNTARERGFSYVEVGGWALDESVRGSSDALRSILFTYAWSKVIGGCLGLSTATHKNGSASILRRIGGRPLEWDGQELPAYYDPQFKCDMEVIRFDSDICSPKYQYAIEQMRLEIPAMEVIGAGKPVHQWDAFASRMRRPAPVSFPWHIFNPGFAVGSN